MREIVEKVIIENKSLCFANTDMILDIICEQLYYKHGLDATWRGRSIYIGNERVASIRTCIEPCEDCKIVVIYSYKMIGG